MNKTLTFLCLLFLIPAMLKGQQIENPGFENWEDVGTVVDEPVDWSSIKTCDLPSIANVAPVTFEQSTDAHSGNYSLKLYNVNAFGIVATGAICNGRFHAEFDLAASYSYTDANDPQWHTVCTYRPDSLAGWFKYFPEEDDIAQFKLILHVDECKLPENGTMDNWVGMAVYQSAPGVTYDSWTRFSVPFEYYDSRTPEYFLCVLNSGDSTAASVGSWLLTDDLELIYNNASTGEHTIQSNYLHMVGGVIHIDLSADQEFLGKPFKVTDLLGRVVFAENLSGRTVSGLPKDLPEGMYLAVLELEGTRHVQKIYFGK